MIIVQQNPKASPNPGSRLRPTASKPRSLVRRRPLAPSAHTAHQPTGPSGAEMGVFSSSTLIQCSHVISKSTYTAAAQANVLVYQHHVGAVRFGSVWPDCTGFQQCFGQRVFTDTFSVAQLFVFSLAIAEYPNFRHQTHSLSQFDRTVSRCPELDSSSIWPAQALGFGSDASSRILQFAGRLLGFDRLS